jgi:hypothetical protein
MTPERKAIIEAWLYAYPAAKMRFRTLTHIEYDSTQHLMADVPQDTVASPHLSDLPHGSEVSDPTARLVLRRAVIELRRQSMVAEMLVRVQEELDRLTDGLCWMADLWADLDGVERAILEWRYWQSEAYIHPLSYQDLANNFLREASTRWAGCIIPATRNTAAEAVHRLLAKLDRQARECPFTQFVGV